MANYRCIVAQIWGIVWFELDLRVYCNDARVYVHLIQYRIYSVLFGSYPFAPMDALACSLVTVDPDIGIHLIQLNQTGRQFA